MRDPNLNRCLVVPLRPFAFLATITLLAAGAPLALSQQAPPRLAPLAFLAGHCWIGTFPDSTSTDEHCYEWIYEGRLLRDRHTVLGKRPPYHGETIFAADPAKDGINYRYFNSAGLLVDGTAEARGDTLFFRETVVGVPSQGEIRSMISRAGAEAYDVEVQQQEPSGAWRARWRMRLRRW